MTQAEIIAALLVAGGVASLLWAQRSQQPALAWGPSNVRAAGAAAALELVKPDDPTTPVDAR